MNSIKTQMLLVAGIGVACAAMAVPPPDRVSELPEFTVYPLDRPVLHITGYVRENSMLTTMRDTVFLFREKLVDFMLPGLKAGKFRGWSRPRILAVRSAYRFTDYAGLDSVSDEFFRHFSWSDWMQLPGQMPLAPGLRKPDAVADTVKGRFARAQLWRREGERVSMRADLLADTVNASWARDLSNSYLHGLDFDKAYVRCEYSDVESEDSVLNTMQIVRYVLDVESAERNREFTRVFASQDPVSVTTHAELYLTDKEYISLKEAKRIARSEPQHTVSDIVAPPWAPPLDARTLTLMARVDAIDRDMIRRKKIPDRRLAGFTDLFKTRRSTWRQIWDMISPPTYNVNTTTYPGVRH